MRNWIIKHWLKVSLAAILFTLYWTEPKTSGDWAAWVQAIGVLGSMAIAIGLARDQRQQQIESELRTRWRRLAVVQALVDDALGLIDMSCTALGERDTAIEYIRRYNSAEAVDVYETMKAIPLLDLQAYEAAAGFMRVRRALEHSILILREISNDPDCYESEKGRARLTRRLSEVRHQAEIGKTDIVNVTTRAWKEVEALMPTGK